MPSNHPPPSLKARPSSTPPSSSTSPTPPHLTPGPSPHATSLTTSGYGASPAVFSIRTLQVDSNSQVVEALSASPEGKALLSKGLIALIGTSPDASTTILRAAPPSVKSIANSLSLSPHSTSSNPPTSPILTDEVLTKILGEFLGQHNLQHVSLVSRHWCRVTWSHVYVQSFTWEVNERGNTWIAKRKSTRYGALTRLCRAESLALLFPQDPSFPLNLTSPQLKNISVMRIATGLSQLLSSDRVKSLERLAVGCEVSLWRQYGPGWEGESEANESGESGGGTTGAGSAANRVNLPSMLNQPANTGTQMSTIMALLPHSGMKNLRVLVLPFESLGIEERCMSSRGSVSAGTSSHRGPPPSTSSAPVSSTDSDDSSPPRMVRMFSGSGMSPPAMSAVPSSFGKKETEFKMAIDNAARKRGGGNDDMALVGSDRSSGNTGTGTTGTGTNPRILPEQPPILLPSLSVLVVKDCSTHFLRGLPNLTHLTVRGRLTPMGGDQWTKVALPKLSSINVKSVDEAFFELDAPNLQKIGALESVATIGSGYNSDRQGRTTVWLRSLTHLDIKPEALQIFTSKFLDTKVILRATVEKFRNLTLRPSLSVTNGVLLDRANWNSGVTDILNNKIQTPELLTLATHWPKGGDATANLVAHCQNLRNLRLSRQVRDLKDLDDLLSVLLPAESTHPSLETLHFTSLSWSPIKTYPRKTPLNADCSNIKVVVIDTIGHPLHLGPIIQKFWNLKTIYVRSFTDGQGFDKTRVWVSASADAVPLDKPSEVSGKWSYGGMCSLTNDYVAPSVSMDVEVRDEHLVYRTWKKR
eukprot:GHVN01005959.1.p1 GENE.GHVN01005959.1~~GHVN01005959.1.p1  ORF type:complete len:811 (-),score=171.46 GHVN01005959.1:424-2856(-)